MKIRLRDILAQVLTPWMANRPGFKTLYTLLWCLVAPLDVLLEVAYQGVQAAWPGGGTPTALAAIGRSRGILRGELEDSVSYSARLRGWIDTWRRAGSSDAIASAVHYYLAGRPKVEVITRAGNVTTCNTDGSITRSTTTWNWDGTSNPERAGYWSELFVVVYTNNFAGAGSWGTADGQAWGGSIGTANGFGDTNTVEEFDSVAGLLSQWKAAHSYVRCLIVNTNGTRPTPNGAWGQWDNHAGLLSSRDLTNNFFWEFG